MIEIIVFATFCVIGIPAVIYTLPDFIGNFQKFNHQFEDSQQIHTKVTKLRWKTIKDLYKLNRKRWRYELVISSDTKKKSLVPCLLYNSGDEWIRDSRSDRKIPPYKNAYQIVRVQLSFFDYIKFLFAKKFAKEKDLGAEIIMTTAQKDIDKIRELAMNQIHESQKAMDEIIKKQKAKEDKDNITLTL